ncbi:MAG TPA: glycosyltransferase family 2 protein [Alphaproteobacteria bacterium]|jgi:ceramide glucosyltransferase
MNAAAAIAWLAVLGFFLASAAAVLMRRRRVFAAPPGPATIIVPIKGAAPSLARNLEGLARLESFSGEIILAVAAARDPAYAIAAPIAAADPGRVQLLVGEAAEFANPKLRNVAKAYRAARHDAIVFFDDTVAVDAALLNELLGRLAAGARAVTAAPLGCAARGLPAEIEAATCNGYLLRIEALLDVLGLAAGFGNAFAFRKSDLEAAGGFARLAEGPCEDNALARALRGLGGRFELARRYANRPIGARSWRDLALRHLRWKNCTKCHDPLAFVLEIWIGGLVFNLLGAVALAGIFGLSWWAALGASAAIWYGGELLLGAAAGWPLVWLSPVAWVLRDLAHPALTIVAAFTREIEWRGARIETRWRWPLRARR